MTAQQSSVAELLAELAESQAVLDRATRIEGVARSNDGAVRVVNLAELAELLVQSRAYIDTDPGTRLQPQRPVAIAELVHPPVETAGPAEVIREPEPPTLIDTAEAERFAADDALEEALRKCAAAADTGFQEAVAHVTALGNMVDQIQGEANRLARAAGTNDTDTAFREQIAQILRDLKNQHSSLGNEIEDKLENLSAFNITLFGRTMTGKSTLMEILTHGDGKSIGKGAQRTTRNVREYEWKGLTVTDVPGVAAFEGAEDEETAHKAANQADLVLFLISDDGPQAEEAKHLARLRRQGKSMLGIFNAKAAINASDDRSVRRFLRDQEKLFEDSRIRAISRQFDEMADKHFPGQRLELVSAHLRARYLAGLPENAGKPWRDDLERSSRFREVENRILREVTDRGPFLRTNSFLNIAAVADLQAWEAARQAADLGEQAQLRLKGRLDELRSWLTGFKRRANQRIDGLIQQTVGSLRNQIHTFVNQYCEDRSLADKWNARVRNTGIDQKCEALQKQLADECQNYFKQLVADSQQELALLENQFQTVAMTTGKITDTRRRWNWGVTYAGSALGGITAGLFLSGAALGWNPVGWTLLAAGAIVTIAGLVGNLFKSRDKKRREAIAKITPQLHQNLDGIERQVRDDINKWLDDFTRQCLNQVEGRFNRQVRNQGRMAGLMRSVADQQRESLLMVNRTTIVQALQHLGAPDASRRFSRVARIPGQAVVITTAGNRILPDEDIAGLGPLLGEEIIRVPDQMGIAGIENALNPLDQKTRDRLLAQLA